MKIKLLLLFLLWTPCVWAKPKVVAVQYPLAFFAETLAGDDFEVTNLTPPGVEPHDYKPGLRSLAVASRADLFLYNSESTEPWASRFSREISRQGGQVFEARLVFDPTHVNRFDPHWWLDPLMVVRYAEKLAAQMIQVSPKAEANINGRLQVLERKVLKLDMLYVSRLKTCKRRKMVVGHDAYRYLANRYRLETFPLQGITAESKPSLAHMAAAIKWIKRNRIKAIFVEELTNPQLSETLAEEVNVETIQLTALGNLSLKESQEKKGYFELMNQNLQRLGRGLECPTIH